MVDLNNYLHCYWILKLAFLVNHHTGHTPIPKTYTKLTIYRYITDKLYTQICKKKFQCTIILLMLKKKKRRICIKKNNLRIKPDFNLPNTI